MANIPINPFCLLRKRCFAVVAESLRLQVKTNVNVRESALANASAAKNKEGVFWMRDPKTGNWIPEDHFDEVDVVELREKFLPKRTLPLKRTL